MIVEIFVLTEQGDEPTGEEVKFVGAFSNMRWAIKTVEDAMYNKLIEAREHNPDATLEYASRYDEQGNIAFTECGTHMSNSVWKITKYNVD